MSWCKFVTHTQHDDVIKWKHFPRYWPIVRGIHRSTVNSPHKGQWHGALIFSLKRLSKQSWGWWFETLSHPLWRHRNELTSGSWHDETKNENHPSIFSNLPVIITTECFVDTPWPVSPIYFFWLRSTNYYYFWRNREAAPTIILHTGVSNEIFQ